MAKNNETAVAEPETETVEVTAQEVVQEIVQDEQPSGEAVGVRSRRGFAMKNLIPNPDWINKNIVAKGKGHKETVGRVFGLATGYERKTNDVQGRLVESIAVKGMFQAVSYTTGELSEATSVFFPMAYAEKIAALMEADETIKVVEVDCDIGLEATGKAIPYEWVVIAFVEGREMDRMKRLRNSRPIPEGAQKLLAATGNLAIEDKSEASAA